MRRCMILLALKICGPSWLWELPCLLHHWLCFFRNQFLPSEHSLCNTPTVFNSLPSKFGMNFWRDDDWDAQLTANMLQCSRFFGKLRQLAMRHFKLQSSAPSNTLPSPSVATPIVYLSSCASSVHPLSQRTCKRPFGRPSQPFFYLDLTIFVSMLLFLGKLFQFSQTIVAAITQDTDWTELCF